MGAGLRVSTAARLSVQLCRLQDTSLLPTKSVGPEGLDPLLPSDIQAGGHSAPVDLTNVSSFSFNS